MYAGGQTSPVNPSKRNRELAKLDLPVQPNARYQNTRLSLEYRAPYVGCYRRAWLRGVQGLQCACDTD